MSSNSRNDISGFKVLPTRERRRLWAKACLRACLYWQTWLAFLILIGLAALGERLGGKWGRELGNGIGLVIFGSVLVVRARQLLRDELRKR
jgi:hypothetical protein